MYPQCYPGGSRILHGRTDRSVYSGAEWVVGRSVARERLPCQRPGHYPASAPRGVGQPYPRVWGHTRWKKADTQFKLNIRGFMLRPLAIKYLEISYKLDFHGYCILVKMRINYFSKKHRFVIRKNLVTKRCTKNPRAGHWAKFSGAPDLDLCPDSGGG